MVEIAAPRRALGCGASTPRTTRLAHAWVSNRKPNKMANNSLKYQRIDPQLREAMRAKWNQPVLWPLRAAAGGHRCSYRSPPCCVYRRRERSARQTGRGDCQMIAYIVRRVLYAIPILIGVNVITFALFFVVNTPDDMARMQLGQKRVTPEAIAEMEGRSAATTSRCSSTPRRAGIGKLTDTIFFEKSVKHVRVRFRPRRTTAATSATRSARACGRASRSRCRCSSSGLLCYITFALLMAFFRAHLHRFLGRGAVRGDDVDLGPVLHHRRAVPDQQAVEPGADLRLRQGGFDAWKFLVLPVVIGVVGGVGGAARAGTARSSSRRSIKRLRAHRARQGAVGDCACCSGTCCRTP